MTELQNIKVVAGLLCPKCQKEATALDARENDDSFELLCGQCHQTLLKADIVSEDD